MGLYKKFINIFAGPKLEKSSAKIIHLDATESTNSYLTSYSPDEGEGMTVVVADYQTAGGDKARTRGKASRGKTCSSLY